MAKSSNDILFKFLGDTKSLDRATKNASKSMGGAQTASLSLTKAMGALGVAFGAREILNFAGDAIQLAVAADEVDAKFKEVFGSAVEFRKALEEWGDVAGVTKTRGEDLAATFGNLAQAQGITEEDTKDLTLAVATLAGDMASFNDADPEEVFFDLNKALLTTEREGLKKYGIAISETEVKTLAATIATADGRTEVTKADRAYASYKIAVQQAGKAVGDLARTSDSTANVQRQLKAQLEETQEEIGRRLLPVYQDLLEITLELAPALGLVADALGEVVGDLAPFTGGLADVADESLSVTERLGGAKDAVFAWGHAILRWSPGSFVWVRILERIKDEAAGVKITQDKAAKSVKELGGAVKGADDALVGYGQELGRLSDEGNDAASALDRVAASSRRIIAARLEFLGLRKLLGGSSGGKAIPFATGGVVPGPRGSPVAATVHGGEEILTPGQQSRSGGGANITINVTSLDPDAAAVAVADALRSYTDRYGPL